MKDKYLDLRKLLNGSRHPQAKQLLEYVDQCQSRFLAESEGRDSLRERLEAALAKVEAAERSYIEESSRNCEAERALRDALLDVLSSATPHPVDHPSMWRTWRRANVLLGRDPDTHVIPTSDKELEMRIMSGVRP